MFAGLGARLLAGIIDGAALFAASWLLQRVGGRQAQFPAATLAVLSAAYFILGYGPTGKGYSLGKRAAGIRVVDHAGGVLSAWAAAVRWFVSVGIALPVAAVAAGLANGHQWSLPAVLVVCVPITTVLLADGLLVLTNRPSRQSLHDLAAGSFVVVRTHTGPVPASGLRRAEYAWIGLSALAATWLTPTAYRYAREMVPRTVELARASDRVRLALPVSNLIVVPGFAVDGTDTTRFVSLIATIKAAPTTEHEAEVLRRALACALAREAPQAFRGAELDAIISFEPGSVPTGTTHAYLADTELTAAACASTRAPF